MLGSNSKALVAPSSLGQIPHINKFTGTPQHQFTSNKRNPIPSNQLLISIRVDVQLPAGAIPRQCEVSYAASNKSSKRNTAGTKWFQAKPKTKRKTHGKRIKNTIGTKRFKTKQNTSTKWFRTAFPCGIGGQAVRELRAAIHLALGTGQFNTQSTDLVYV